MVARAVTHSNESRRRMNVGLRRLSASSEGSAASPNAWRCRPATRGNALSKAGTDDDARIDEDE